MTTLPMFPLSSVIFPESLFTLRVFEPRYLELVKECVMTGRGFGVCLIAKGHEVGGEMRDTTTERFQRFFKQ